MYQGRDFNTYMYLESCLTHLDDMIRRYLPPSLVQIAADYAPPQLLAAGTSVNMNSDGSCLLEGENVAHHDGDECTNEMAHAHPRSASLLLLLFVALLILLAMIIATCILLIRLLLAERRVRHAETDKLLDRTTSGFHLGSFFGRSESTTAAAAATASDDAPDMLYTEKDNDDDEDELNATPGHLHALHGRSSPAVLLVGRTSSSSSLRQRTNSTGGGGATDSLNSSIHSINEDILLDRCGMEDLVPPPHPPSPSSSSDNQKETMSSSLSRLNTVSERMSEETLDDCHAFTDVSKMTRRTESFDARANEVEEHGALECVRECDDDDDDDDGDGDDDDDNDNDEEEDDIELRLDNTSNTGSPESCPKRASGALFDLLHTVSSPDEMKELHDSRREMERTLSQKMLLEEG